MTGGTTFSDLLVDQSEATAQRTADALKGRVQLDPVRGDVYVVATEISARKRVVLTVLGRKALMLHAKEAGDAAPQYEDRLAPKEVERLTGLAGGTVRPVLRELVNERLLQQDDKGYFVPDAALARVSALLNEEG